MFEACLRLGKPDAILEIAKPEVIERDGIVLRERKMTADC